jgi:hypothetical protein
MLRIVIVTAHLENVELIGRLNRGILNFLEKTMIWIINQTSSCPGNGMQIVALLEGDNSPVDICRQWWEDNIVNGPLLHGVPPVGPAPVIQVPSRNLQGRVIVGEMEFISNPCDLEYNARLLKRIAVLAVWYGLDERASLDEVFVSMLTREHGYKHVAYSPIDLTESVRPT